MEKKIQDYLHLYLGCEVYAPNGLTYKNSYSFFYRMDNGEYSFSWDKAKPILRPLESMTEEEATHLADLYSEWAWRKEFFVTQLAFAGHAAYITIYYRIEGSPHGIGDGEYSEQLIVTADSIWARDSVYTDRYKIVLNVHRITHYLFSKSFDLFGLIESGLAISSPTKQ